jgi:putative transposase
MLLFVTIILLFITIYYNCVLHRQALSIKIYNMRKEKFVPNEYYHIYNRTIFNIPEFKEPENAKKLLNSFLIANSTKSGEAFLFLRNNKNAKINDALKITKQGQKLVDVLCYVIMPAHYHLLLKERQENGIINFVHKCDISISKYINIKKERKGSLFEGRFSSKHINSDEYLVHLSVYIHLNPLDFLVGKNWREHKLKNWLKAKNKLLAYQWTSLKSYISNIKDPVISGQKIIMDQFDTKSGYEQYLKNWSKESSSKIEDLLF